MFLRQYSNLGVAQENGAPLLFFFFFYALLLFDYTGPLWIYPIETAFFLNITLLNLP